MENNKIVALPSSIEAVRREMERIGVSLDNLECLRAVYLYVKSAYNSVLIDNLDLYCGLTDTWSVYDLSSRFFEGNEFINMVMEYEKHEFEGTLQRGIKELYNQGHISSLFDRLIEVYPYLIEEEYTEEIVYIDFLERIKNDHKEILGKDKRERELTLEELADIMFFQKEDYMEIKEFTLKYLNKKDKSLRDYVNDIQPYLLSDNLKRAYLYLLVYLLDSNLEGRLSLDNEKGYCYWGSIMKYIIRLNDESLFLKEN